MSFTDRFIRVPIKVYDVKEKELTGNENCQDSWMKFNPLEIASYRPCTNDAYAEDGEATIVVLKSGDTSTVYIHPQEFEKLINDHLK